MFILFHIIACRLEGPHKTQLPTCLLMRTEGCVRMFTLLIVKKDEGLLEPYMNHIGRFCSMYNLETESIDIVLHLRLKIDTSSYSSISYFNVMVI